MRVTISDTIPFNSLYKPRTRVFLIKMIEVSCIDIIAISRASHCVVLFCKVIHSLKLIIFEKGIIKKQIIYLQL